MRNTLIRHGLPAISRRFLFSQEPTGSSAGLCPPHLLQRRHRGRLARPLVVDPRADELPVREYTTPKVERKLRTYMWGNAQTGAVGVAEYPFPSNGSKKPPIRKKHFPIRLPFCELFGIRFKQVSCGFGFTLFLAKDPDMQNNSVFGTGINTDSQIGFQPAQPGGKSLKVIVAPVPIDIPLRNRKAKILKVAAGRAHSIFLTEEGCFSTGNNAYGQCGRKIVEKESYASNPKIHRIQDVPADVVDIFCGQDTTYFLTATGGVYSCGWGADGQTGIGHYDMTSTPTLVKGDISGENIVHLSSAADCVLALSEKGDIFGWGNSEYQQFATVTSAPQIHTPMNLPFKNIGKVKSVSAGGTVCGLVDNLGQVFVWGFGLLGKGPEFQQSPIPSQMPPTLFEAREFGETNPVESITCGLMHSAIITERGDLYTWGSNEFGQLGLGNQRIQYFPLRVTIAATVKQISLGVDHTAAICKALI